MLSAFQLRRRRAASAEPDAPAIGSAEHATLVDEWAKPAAPALVDVSEDAVRAAAVLRAACRETRNWVLVAGLRDEDAAAAVATRLALALVQMGVTPLLLVDGDLRSRPLHPVFSRSGMPGLAELVRGSATVDDAVRPLDGGGLWVLPAGRAGGDPVGVLGSPAHADLAQALRKRFRFVISTVAPFLDFPDAALVAPRTDGVVLVARAGHRARRELREVKRVLDASHVSILGVLLAEVVGAPPR